MVIDFGGPGKIHRICNALSVLNDIKLGTSKGVFSVHFFIPRKVFLFVMQTTKWETDLDLGRPSELQGTFSMFLCFLLANRSGTITFIVKLLAISCAIEGVAALCSDGSARKRD